MNQRKSTVVAPSQLTRLRAERISALEGLRLSKTMQAKFAIFDAQGLSADERRAQLLAHFKNN